MKILYQELASVTGILGNMKVDHPWYKHWLKKQDYLEKFLPHGSGVNYNYSFNIKNHGKLVDVLQIHNAFDYYDDVGYLDTSREFTVNVIPDLVNSYYIMVTGVPIKYSHAKEYIEQLFQESLMQEIPDFTGEKQ